jgi:L-ascorbate metabolism protein UlaG (beta-lactamase superfamily)
MTVKFTWLGHSAFAFEIDGHAVLIDPFLTGNPLAPTTANELDAEVILLSHAHGDHSSDVADIANRTGATVVTNFECGNWFMNKGVKNVAQGNPGGSYHNDFMSVKWTIAHHSSSFPDGSYGGQPNGFIITAKGYKIYYAGDTGLFLDMQIIGDEGIDVAFLPIGDVFTMGIDDSLRAIGFVAPKYVVPMHYNTWPPITQNASDWANRVNSETDAKPIVLDPGGEYILS